MAKPRRAFRPDDVGPLEGRALLSAGFGSPPHRLALLHSLTDRQRVFPPRTPPVLEQIDRAFDAFARDYEQARAVFFDSVVNGASSEVSSEILIAFEGYTIQRVNLLAEELNASLQNPLLGTGKRRLAGSSAVSGQVFIATKISALPNGDDNSQVQPFRRSLLTNLLIPLRQNPFNPDDLGGNSGSNRIDSIPRSSVPFIILSQDNAIESARTSVVNGIGVYKRLFANAR